MGADRPEGKEATSCDSEDYYKRGEPWTLTCRRGILEFYFTLIMIVSPSHRVMCDDNVVSVLAQDLLDRDSGSEAQYPE